MTARTRCDFTIEIRRYYEKNEKRMNVALIALLVSVLPAMVGTSTGTLNLTPS